jgi:hypothetical protein
VKGDTATGAGYPQRVEENKFTNRREDQELTVLCLHLLRASLVYINTLMIQQLLDDPATAIILGPEDLRGLSPLLWSHVNPYGVFRLDLSRRLPLAA